MKSGFSLGEKNVMKTDLKESYTCPILYLSIYTKN